MGPFNLAIPWHGHRLWPKSAAEESAASHDTTEYLVVVHQVAIFAGIGSSMAKQWACHSLLHGCPRCSITCSTASVTMPVLAGHYAPRRPARSACVFCGGV
eukprot:scaffold141986_cov29-Tisochrysis_lutea.AAC.1